MPTQWLHKFTHARRDDALAKRYGRKRVALTVEAGLHQLGEQSPYFSVTAAASSPGHPTSPFVCGQMRDDVARLFPALIPVLALHLSDEHGVPMHAEPNAWYWLAGYYGGAGEQYHGTNDRTHGKMACLDIFAKHVRISSQLAFTLAESWRPAYGSPWSTTREQMAAWIEEQRPRWQQEADAAISLLDDLNGAVHGQTEKDTK